MFLVVESGNVSEMALEVALELEETRKKEARQRILESKDDPEDMDTMIYSLDELTQIEKNKKQVSLKQCLLNILSVLLTRKCWEYNH